MKFPRKEKTDIHGDNGAFCYKGFQPQPMPRLVERSHGVLAEEVLGIRISEPGCKRSA
ncbi:MAG: hypothetical protein ACLR56_09815 [Oscillospiraceae bacterium]